MDAIDTSTWQQSQLEAGASELAQKLRGTAASQIVERLEHQPQADEPADDALDLYA